MSGHYFHGSHEEITEITASGMFGGLFASVDEGAALSHGPVLHLIRSPRPLSNFELNYEIEGAYEIALELAEGDEALADSIMSKECEIPENMDGGPWGRELGHPAQAWCACKPSGIHERGDVRRARHNLALPSRLRRQRGGKRRMMPR